MVLWEIDYSLAPADPKERMKLWITMLELVKKDIDSGFDKFWGMNPGGGCGFAVSDRDEKEIFASLARFTPYVKFKVEPVLSVDEVIETLKGM